MSNRLVRIRNPLENKQGVGVRADHCRRQLDLTCSISRTFGHACQPSELHPNCETTTPPWRPHMPLWSQADASLRDSSLIHYSGIHSIYFSIVPGVPHGPTMRHRNEIPSGVRTLEARVRPPVQREEASSSAGPCIVDITRTALAPTTTLTISRS